MFDDNRVSAAVGSQPVLMRQIAGHPPSTAVQDPDGVITGNGPAHVVAETEGRNL